MSVKLLSPALSPPKQADRAVAISTSVGGMAALHAILTALPPSLTAAVLVVQHLLPDRDSHLAKILSWHTRLEVTQAESEQRLFQGTMYVAPPDAHLIVGIDRRLALSHLPPVHHCRPMPGAGDGSIWTWARSGGFGRLSGPAWPTSPSSWT